MTTREIRELYDARPFRPFAIHMADGRRVKVEHPEFMSFAPSGRSVHVFEPDGSAHWIDMLLVTDLERKPNGAHRRGRKR